MKIFVSINSTFHCSLERAFKTPMLCDITKVHTGFLFSPKVIGVEEDEGWGQIGSSKKIIAAPSITQSGGFLFMDRITDRKENVKWKLQVDNFQSWMWGFTKFEGEWITEEVKTNEVVITYNYVLYANKPLFYPINWLFARVFWKVYMKRVLENVREMAYDEEPYQYD